ncbi:MAG: GNAT family N-acetyltransferase [Patescibacteria group bacterium]
MDEMLVKIIKLSAEHWAKYKAIRLEALKSDPIAFADIYDNVVVYEDSYWRNRLINPEEIWLFAEIDSHIVGMIGTYLRVNNQPLESAAIVGVYVSKNYRGKGISRKLMNQMLEEISKTGFIKKVKLWVAEIQNSARKLYEKSGFKYIGKDKKNIEHNGKVYEEFIMEKDLA